MTTGEKIYRQRRNLNMTQEQLADYLKVTRQAISRWEGDVTLPEADKLFSLSKLFGCSVDYLLNEDENIEEKGETKIDLSSLLKYHFEYVSKKKIFGMPLVHINFGLNKTAKGFFAIGFKAIGIFSFGLLSLGIFAFGLLAMGIIGLGNFALGLLSGGAISVGLFSFGAISIGVLSIGAVSIGEFALGAASIGNYFAIGDDARAMVAIGASNATGSLYSYSSGVSNLYTGYDAITIKMILDEKVPDFIKWIKDFALFIAGVK